MKFDMIRRDHGLGKNKKKILRSNEYLIIFVVEFLVTNPLFIH